MFYDVPILTFGISGVHILWCWWESLYVAYVVLMVF